MKRASRVLGIVAGIIGLGGAVSVFSKIKTLSMTVTPKVDLGFGEVLGVEPSNSDLLTQGYIVLVIVTGVLCAVGAILGITGGILVRKNSAAASALMVTGGVLNGLSDLYFGVVVLLLLGGIFALVGDRVPAGREPQQQRSGGAVKTAARLIGITGGAVTMLCAARYFVIYTIEEYGLGSAFSPSLVLLAVLGGAVAVAGGLLVKQSRLLAGVLMLIGALASLLGLSETFPFILLLVGGVFALIPGRAPAPSAAGAPGEACASSNKYVK